MTTCALQNLSELENSLNIARQILESSKPFSYYLICKKENALWDFFYITESGEISHHRIKCYKIGKLTIYKNAGEFLSRTLEKLMSHLIGRPISSCFQVGLRL